jgi:hypothetical protein
MKFINIILTTGLFALSLHASTESKPKQTLQANYMVNYKTLPKEVNNLSDIFTEGMVYGRLRAHWFFYDWEKEIEDKTQNHNILGLGGSLVYKTAPYAGFSATAGLYYTSAGTNLDNQPSNVGLLKSGKDVISRYNAINGKGKSFAVLAQSYLQYEHSRFKARFGREIFNSFFTKSNDSKMIPNTFEGFTIESKDIEKTRLRAAYLNRQKLRDHDNFHSTIMFDDRSTAQSGDIKIKWNSNDDTASHKGLNYSNFQVHGIDDNTGLFIVDGYTRAVLNKKLKISASAVYLKDLFYTAMLELNYKFDLGNGYTLSPGVRYVQQFDNGAGHIGGASISGAAARTTASSTVGLDQSIRDAYTDPDSVDAKLYAARLVLKKNAASLGLGYTKVADEADFITPWRGFMTAGYTRAMARYNWIANTETWRLRFAYDFNKANQVKGLRTFASFTRENYDSQKIASLANFTNVYYFGLIQNITPEASFRFRSSYVDERNAELPDHSEVRLELNYLF